MEVVDEISEEVMEESVVDTNQEQSSEYDDDSDRTTSQSKSHKQSYRKAWESLPDFKGWLRGVDGQPNRAFCTYCQVSLFAHRLSLLKHTCTLKHQRAAQRALLRVHSNGVTSTDPGVPVVPSTSQTNIQHIPADNNKLNLRPIKIQQNLPSNMTVTIIQDGGDEPIELELEQNIVEENSSLAADDDELGLNTVQTVQLQEDQESEPAMEPVTGHTLKMASASNSPLSAHVLDTTKGRPAAHVPISLYRLIDSRWTLVNESVTDQNGRCGELLQKQDFVCGRYKLHFDTGRYFELEHKQTMFPFVEIPFDVHSVSEHYHIPLILSLYGYSTYRGS